MNVVKMPEVTPSNRRFEGLGAQSDGFLTDRRNAQCGVTGEDLLLNERRLAALRLANARMFVDVLWFDPNATGDVTCWDNEDLQHFLGHLRRHKVNGTRCNLVLFKPMHPSEEEVPALVRAMIAFLKHLIHEEGMTNVAWLTFWNEPESIFPYDSPLSRRVWGDDLLKRRPGFQVYVDANRLAYELLHQYDLDRFVKLVVPDAVWGARIRKQQMELALEAFHNLDVVYAYHNYNPEDISFYEGNEDFAYEGVGQEARNFRSLLGPDRPLFITEFNSATGHGFNSHCLGFGPAGQEWIGTVDAAVDTIAKVIIGATEGIDGISFWCAHDVVYEAHGQPMPTGLWRYKTAGWHPRPVYHYYALLVDVLRPGAAISQGRMPLPAEVQGLASLSQHGSDLVLLNTSRHAIDLHLSLPEFSSSPIEVRRVNPGEIPPLTDRLCARTDTVIPDRSGTTALRLNSGELVACRVGAGGKMQNANSNE